MPYSMPSPSETDEETLSKKLAALAEEFIDEKDMGVPTFVGVLETFKYLLLQELSEDEEE